MIKKLSISILVLGLLAVAAVYFIGSKGLNSGVKAGIEKIGPRITLTPITLESVSLSPFTGGGSLKGLKVGNPEGFKNENIFSLGQIDIQVDTGSIMSDTIVIKKLHIREPAISYEKKLTTSNLKKLQKNIEAFTGADKKEPASHEEENKAASKNLLIEDLIIEGGTIYIGALGLGQKVPLPRIEMQNIGGAENETNVADVIDEILGAILGNVGPAIAGAADLGKDAANVIKTQGLEKAEEAGKAVSEGLKSIFGQ